MSKRTKLIIYIISITVFGSAWGMIYLVLAKLHNMTNMFNDTYIFLIGTIFNFNDSSTTMGFIFSFIDGSLLGLLFGFVIIKIGGKYLYENRIRN